VDQQDALQKLLALQERIEFMHEVCLGILETSCSRHLRHRDSSVAWQPTLMAKRCHSTALLFKSCCTQFGPCHLVGK
jgi:hypothetical protein